MTKNPLSGIFCKYHKYSKFLDYGKLTSAVLQSVSPAMKFDV
jgi:hypothetical protein